MIIAISIFVVVLVAILVLSVLNGDRESKSLLSRRMKQQSSSFRENALKKKFEEIAEERGKATKKEEVRTNCLQAGFDLNYGEFKLISIGSAILLPIISLVITNNLILSLVFIIVGYFLPGQVINFLKNRRMTIMENQVGSFLKLVIERYKAQGDFASAVEGCLGDYVGQEPMYSELKKTVSDMKSGIPTTDAMSNLARRTGNKYLYRFADFHSIANDLGTSDVRANLLNQAFVQFEENRKLKSHLKSEIAGPVREAYTMLLAIPGMIIYQIFTSDTYLDFMLNTTLGKIGSAVILTVLMGAVWFINAQIGKPIE